MSTIRVDNFGPSAGGTAYSARGVAKAWVNFNGTGTIAARDSENVSSLTDNGTGDYTVAFSSAFSSSDYILTSGQSISGIYVNGPYYVPGQTKSTTQLRINAYSYALGNGDNPEMYLSIHGDLA